MKNIPVFDPCPFCGAEIFPRLYDEVCNAGDEYTEGKYVLIHGETTSVCPIVHYDREYLEMITYDSPEEAAEIWNTRYDPKEECHV